MKKMFFLLMCLYISVSILPAHAQKSEQNDCPYKHNKYHLEQKWPKIKYSKDSLLDSMFLFSDRRLFNKGEYICLYYKNKEIFYSKVPQKGKWRIHNISKKFIFFNSRDDKLIIFDIVNKSFSAVKAYSTKIETGPHPPDK